MNETRSRIDRETLSADQLLELERVCDRFEDACRREGAADPAAALAGASPAVRPVLVRELLLIALAYCPADRREAVRAEYRARFPGYAAALGDSLGSTAGGSTRPFDAAAPTVTPSAGSTADLSPAPAPRASADAPAIPGYALEGEIDRGGMGVVYRARQVALNRVVAVKLVRSGATASHAELVRFLAEAEAVAAIDHPNVVRVYESGSHDGCPYIAMELLPGGTLTSRLRDGGRLAVRAAAEVVRRVCEGVAAAHDRGIIHRDLKPGNVLFDAAGEPKVVDFGLAKRGSTADLTATGAVMGTPAYMAPEQARGRAKFVGPAADVWALGVILFECLTGQTPFRGPDPWAIVRRVATEEAPSPRSVARDVPRDLELICLKCLRSEAHERYPSARELADDLANYLAGRSISARSMSGAERTWRWAKRNPGYAALWAGLATALLVGAGVSLWQADRANREAGVATARAGELADALQATQAAESRERERAGELDVALTTVSREQQKTSAVLEHSERLRTNELVNHAAAVWANSGSPDATRELLARVPDSERRFEWHYLWRQTETLGGMKVYGTGPLVWGADGKTLYRWTGYRVELLDHLTGQVRASISPPQHLGTLTGEPQTQPGVETLLIPCTKGAIEWDANSGRQAVIKYPENSRDVEISPTRTHLAGVVGNEIQIWDGSSSRKLCTIPGSQSGSFQIFGPSQPRLCVVIRGLKPRLRIHDANTGKVLVEREVPVGADELGRTLSKRVFAFSPDERRVAIRQADGTVAVWDFESAKEVFTLKGLEQGGVVMYTADGRHILATGRRGAERGGVRCWDALTGEVVTDYSGGFYPTGTPDGTGVLYTEDLGRNRRGGGGIREGLTGEQLMAIQDASLELERARFSPSGDALATTTRGPAPYSCILNTRVGRDTSRLKVSSVATDEVKGIGTVLGIAFFPDGSRIATVTYPETSVRIWNVHSGEPLGELKTPVPLKQLALSRDGRWLVACGEKDPEYSKGGFSPSKVHPSFLFVWDLQQGKLVREWQAHKGEAVTVGVSPDGSRVVSTAYEEPATVVWDPSTGKRLHDLPHGAAPEKHLDPIFGQTASFNHDGSRVLVSYSSGPAREWDTATGRLVREWKAEDRGNYTRAYWSPDGRQVMLRGKAGSKVVDASTGGLVCELTGNASGVQPIWSPDGSRVALYATNAVGLWDTRTGQRVLEVPIPPPSLMVGSFSPDGLTLVIPGEMLSSSIRVVEAHAPRGVIEVKSTLSVGKILGLHLGHVSPAGKWYASSYYSDPLRVWDTATGKVVYDLLPPDGGALTEPWYNPSSSLLLTRVRKDENYIGYANPMDVCYVWDAATGKLLTTLRGYCWWAPDGEHLLLLDAERGVKLVDARTGKETKSFGVHQPKIRQFAWSRDGTRFVFGCQGGVIRVGDLQTGRFLYEVKPATKDGLVGVGFSRSGDKLVALALTLPQGTEAPHLWDAATGKPLPGDGVRYEVSRDLSMPVSRETTADGKQVVFMQTGFLLVGPVGPEELLRRRRQFGPDPDWHAAQRKAFLARNNAFAAAFHHSQEHRARGELAVEAGDFQRAFGHFLAAELLRPKPVNPDPPKK